jgi:transcription-repair coupling factor (superfamily II helicase)
VLEFLKKSKSLETFKKAILKDFSFLIDNLKTSSLAVLIFYLQKTDKDILIITSEKSDTLFLDLSTFLSNILEFPALETSEEVPSPDILGKRFSTLKKLLKPQKNSIVVTSFLALLQKIPHPKNLKNLLFTWEKDEKISLSKAIKKLESIGYIKKAVVSDKGEFAIRGGILDIFSTFALLPYRIEFFEDEIKSIRTFDPQDQRTIEKIGKAHIYPKKEMEKNALLLDYLKKDSIIVFDNLIELEENYINFKNLFKDILSFEELLEKTEKFIKIFCEGEKIENISKIKFFEREKYFENISFEILEKTIKTKKWLHPFLDILDFEVLENENITFQDYLKKTNLPILFFSENLKILKNHLKNSNIPPKKTFSYKEGFLSSSFIIADIPLGIASDIEFTHKKKIRRKKWRKTYHTPTSEFHHLSKGDLVVHLHCGIGKYQGIETKKNHLGEKNDFLVIEYSKNSKLFTPLSQAHLVSRYIGVKDEKPFLSDLGDKKWQKTKNLSQKKIVLYAKDLLKLYAERSVRHGFKYPTDSEDLKLFELFFEYDETIDQLKAIEEIKKDMESQKPMERLICGDVGYGKTEVAARAAFKAVDGGKQVALLVPTTILAMQHFETFKERMREFPIIIEMVSRFNSPKTNKKIIEDTFNGKVDILIGTHRLLSKDVFFKNLGLIIIDEEQRFGVKAKEHLKKLKKGVDSLTLSATPIPRTLYMSLINIRAISPINTPPQDRLPIKTIVSENDDLVIKNAILKELSREGQIFFIHNRVETIDKRTSHIKKLTPKAKILTVHGQMKNDEIDSIFHLFKSGKADILISTTIIENGIDIPNANTIIIDNSQNFGLADLYQLRGRVGRWDRPAYAYFLVPKNKKLKDIAKKRIFALLESSGYGGGIKIAMRDLEIRGAGDILGERQSGQISAIGFHLYCKLLKKTLQSLKDKKPINFIETKMEFPSPAKLPSSYISENSIKMDIYYRLGSAFSFEEVHDIEEELKDRFGALPLEAIWLLELTKIKIFASQRQIISLKFLSFGIQVKTALKKPILIHLPPKKQKSPKILKEFVMEEIKKIF